MSWDSWPIVDDSGQNHDEAKERLSPKAHGYPDTSGVFIENSGEPI
jgi:hypothetical protein